MASSLPRVAIFTEDCLNGSHGTGALLQRYLDGFPADRLCNLYLRRRGSPELDRSFEVPRLPFPATSLLPAAASATRIWNMAASRLPSRPLPVIERPPAFLPLKPMFDQLRFEPDLFFTSAFSLSGLQVIPSLRAALPAVPIHQQFFDYFGSTPFGFKSTLQRAVDCCDRLTAVTPEIAEDVYRHTGRVIEVVPSFHIDLPARSRMPGSRPANLLRAVVIGNFQSPAVLAALRQIWSACQRMVPGLEALRWYCHESSYRALEKKLGAEIVWGGFYRGSAYLDELCKADVCLAPVNVGSVARDDFARYSLPTRVTEPMAVGLPTVVLASRDTALSRYVRDREIGYAIVMGKPKQAAAELAGILNHSEGREAVGQRALLHAREFFGIEKFRAAFWESLQTLGKSRVNS